tara:strand:+ start:1961 stop:2788 length:828 start_codon:yes stop_codon:yes gene_type:complete
MKRAESKRQPGSLQQITKRSKGREYKVWRWRTYRRGDLGWERIDAELGADLTGLRTRLYVAIGRLSAPLLIERWVRWHFRSWEFLPAWTGQPAEAKEHQRAAWWLELPRQSDGLVKVRFRGLSPDAPDFRRARSAVANAEQVATQVWRCLTADPVLDLARLLWFEQEGRKIIDELTANQLELRRLKRQGELSQRDYEADERHTYLKLDEWESMISQVQERHDQLLSELIAAAVRSEREQIKREVLVRVDRHLNDQRQRQRWTAEHWIDHTLHWST